MGCAPRDARRTAGVDSTNLDGDARIRRSENCRGVTETEAALLSGKPALQQLVMHAEGRAAARLGLPDTLGQQAHRRARPDRVRARTDEPAERSRFANTARLSVGSLITSLPIGAPN